MLKNRNSLKKTIVALALSLTWIGNSYAQCAAPSFSRLTVDKNMDVSSWISLTLSPSIAALKLPPDFSEIFVSPAGSLGFKSTKTEFRGVVVFEKTGDYLMPDEEETSIHDYYKSLFTAPKDSYCDYLEPFKIDQKNYQIHLSITGGDVFAFGTESKHSFYILNSSKKDTIVSGDILGVSTDDFKKILQTISIRE